MKAANSLLRACVAGAGASLAAISISSTRRPTINERVHLVVLGQKRSMLMMLSRRHAGAEDLKLVR